MLSMRVSVQRTGRPSVRASHATSTPSGSSIFAPNPPPTSWLDDANVARVETEHAGEHHPVGVRGLRRAPVREASVVVELGGRRARLHRRGGHPLAPEGVGDDHVAAVEEALVELSRIGLGEVRDVRPELGEEQHLALERLLGGEHRRQRVVVDQHELGRVGAGRAVLADDDRDDLACEADDVLRDERPHHPGVDVPVGRGAERRRVDVGAREDPDVRERLRLRRVDARDPRVRDGRADERDGLRPFEGHVLEVAALAAEEARILHAKHAVAEDAHGSEPTVTAPRPTSGKRRLMQATRVTAAESRAPRRPRRRGPAGRRPRAGG